MRRNRKRWLRSILCCLMAAAMSMAASGDVIMIGSVSYTGWTLNETNFPDPEFRAYLSTLDTQHIGFLRDTVEISKIKNLSLGRKNNTSYSWRKGNIKSLKGIEYLTALTDLSAENNQLTGIDLSRNTGLRTIDLSGNKLTALDVSNNTALTEINCYENPLGRIDLSRNINLEHLDCDNNQLTQLNISSNVKLAGLGCWGNKLTQLDVSHNPALAWLDCSSNELTQLDVSGCPYLADLVHNCLRERDTKEGVDSFYDNNTRRELLVDPWVKVTAGSMVSQPTAPVPENVKAAQAIASQNNSSQNNALQNNGSQNSAEMGIVTVKGLNYRLSGSYAIFVGPAVRKVTKITLPATIQSGGRSYKVTQVADRACQGLPSLKTLTIGKNVRIIGKSAFRNCRKLKKITIRTIKLTGSSVKAGAFKGINKKVKIITPKKKKASYRKLLRKKGIGKTAVFK